MGQQTRLRKQQTVTYSAGSKIITTLGRGMIYREIILRLQGALTVTAGNNTQAKTKRGDEWAAVSRIDIVCNGNDIIRSFSGNELWWWNKYMFGASPPVTTTIGDGTTANPSFDDTLIIPFWMPMSVRPMDTALDSSQLSDFRIEVTWADSLAVNADAASFATAPTLDVYSLESFGAQGSVFSGSRLYKLNFIPTGATQNYQVQLPVGPMYRGFLINTTNSAGDTDTTTSVTNIKLYSGTNVFRDIAFATARDWQKLRTNVESPISNGATAVYAQYRRGTANVNNAWTWFDLVQDGTNTECIDTQGFSELNLEFVVATACQINVLPLQIYPIRGG